MAVVIVQLFVPPDKLEKTSITMQLLPHAALRHHLEDSIPVVLGIDHAP